MPQPPLRPRSSSRATRTGAKRQQLAECEIEVDAALARLCRRLCPEVSTEIPVASVDVPHQQEINRAVWRIGVLASVNQALTGMGIGETAPYRSSLMLLDDVEAAEADQADLPDDKDGDDGLCWDDGR